MAELEGEEMFIADEEEKRIKNAVVNFIEKTLDGQKAVSPAMVASIAELIRSMLTNPR